MTNFHVVRDGRKIAIRPADGIEYPAKVIRVDSANDIVILKADGHFDALPILAGSGPRRGDTVATLGFPQISVQGLEPKFTDGIISSVTGIADDPRMFQITVPIQPGNSGGPLVDVRGNVVGIITSRLSTVFAVRSFGDIPQNVNFAVKASYIRAITDSVPGLSNGLLSPRNQPLSDKATLAEYLEKTVALVVSHHDVAATAGFAIPEGRKRVDRARIDRRSERSRAADAVIEDSVDGLLTSCGAECHIRVTSYNGLVLLTGEVLSPERRQWLLRAVRSVLSVRGVFDQTDTREPSSAEDRKTDREIERSVYGRLDQGGVAAKGEAVVIAERRTVYLMGLVRRDEAHVITEIARTTAPVARVVRVFEYLN